MYTELKVPIVPTEMLEWLKENLEGKCFVKSNRERIQSGGCCSSPKRSPQPKQWRENGYKICFGNEEEAFAFKLMWGEYIK